MTCLHPNRIITEFLSGRAIHHWKNGKYAFSDELIELDRVIEECPDCSYKLVLVKGQVMPDDLAARIRRARNLVDNPTGSRNVH